MWSKEYTTRNKAIGYQLVIDQLKVSGNTMPGIEYW